MTTHTDLQSTLTEIGNSQGTLVSLILRKKGVLRGPSTDQKVYGDDLVHVLLWTGFDYEALVKRSLKKLEELTSKGTFCADLTKEAAASGEWKVTLEEAAVALQEVFDSLNQSLAQPPDERPGVFEPYYIGEQKITGAKVYKGKGEHRNSPKPDTIYLDGVKLGEVVLNPGPNGHWAAKHKINTVLKDLIRAKLPVGLYVSYNLAPENLIVSVAGKQASETAKRGGVHVDPESIRSLFKVAA